MSDHFNKTNHSLRLRRLGIDTYQEPVIYMRSDCHVCRSEGFEAEARIRLTHRNRSIIATLNVIVTDLLTPGEAGLSEAAWRALGAQEGGTAKLSHPEPLDSLRFVRAKLYEKRLDASAMQMIVRDIAEGRYSDVHLSSFITACAGNHLDRGEIIALTRAMVEVGEKLEWGQNPIVDKHCIGGLPGNRTTPIIVPIVAAYGLIIPKTSSRAITSPAGTADVMETLAPVNLKVADMRRVVEREGGCIVWGGAVRLSPADDILIRVERALDIDSEGQLIASVLSKKVAAGSTHVVIDIPVGETTKVRSLESATKLKEEIAEVGRAVGLNTIVVLSDGTQPVGRGIGPALEARDVLKVLRGDADAPQDLRERAILLAGQIFELSSSVPCGQGETLAQQILDNGQAWKKFQAICEAQGGMREPARAPLTKVVPASRSGRVVRIDNRKLARSAKLAGAPKSPTAGIEMQVKIGTIVEKGQPLFTLHAATSGESNYAFAYLKEQKEMITIEEPV